MVHFYFLPPKVTVWGLVDEERREGRVAQSTHTEQLAAPAAVALRAGLCLETPVTSPATATWAR